HLGPDDRQPDDGRACRGRAPERDGRGLGGRLARKIEVEGRPERSIGKLGLPRREARRSERRDKQQGETNKRRGSHERARVPTASARSKTSSTDQPIRSRRVLKSRWSLPMK